MGEVIRKDAAAADIFADVRATLAAARARGGVFAELAEMKLEPVLTLLAPLEAEIAAVEATLRPLEVALDVEDDAAIELAAYKRMLKASGVSEAEVHKVIPDRPRLRGARDGAEATPDTTV